MILDCQSEQQSYQDQQHCQHPQSRPTFEAGKTLKFLEGREALQRHLERLESWTTANNMKSNKNKCWILHLWWGNPAGMHKVGDKRLEGSPTERNLEVWVDGKLNMGQQRGSAVSWGAFAFKHSITSCPREVIVLLCNALMRPQLRSCVQFWVPPYQKDIKL